MTKSPDCAVTGPAAAVWKAPRGVEGMMPVVSKALDASGTRKVVPVTLRSPRIPAVSHWIRPPAPIANADALVPLTTAPPGSVQMPASVPSPLLIESPVLGMVMFTSSGRYAFTELNRAWTLPGKAVAVASKKNVLRRGPTTPPPCQGHRSLLRTAIVERYAHAHSDRLSNDLRSPQRPADIASRVVGVRPGPHRAGTSSCGGGAANTTHSTSPQSMDARSPRTTPRTMTRNTPFRQNLPKRGARSGGPCIMTDPSDNATLKAKHPEGM